MSDPVALIVAVTGFVGAAVGFLGWYRERQKDRSTERRSDLDIVLSAYQELVNDEAGARDRTKKELGEAMKRALDCEERERILREEVDALDTRVRLLEGARR